MKLYPGKTTYLIIINKISKVIEILYRLKYAFGQYSPKGCYLQFTYSNLVLYINYELLLWGVDCHKLET